MTNLIGALRSRQAAQRSGDALSFGDWLEFFNFNGLNYGIAPPTTLGGAPEEKIDPGFAANAEQVYKRTGPVFACMAVRALVFSEARFQWRRFSGGRPGDLFGTADLDLLEHPWPNGTTGQLMSRAMQFVDLSGNFFATPRGTRTDRRIRVLRPDWVTIITGSKTGKEIDAELVGYVYQPRGYAAGDDPEILLPDEVAHWAPYPDPMYRFRGMSWLTPIIREAQADAAATVHRLKFFQNGATANTLVKFDPTVTLDAAKKWKDAFEGEHAGFLNAYKTVYMGGGADMVPIGSNMKDADFAGTQAGGETRIAAAAGVPPVLVGMSEGIRAATYSNYQQARRRFGDATMRPLWRDFCGAMQTIAPPPDNSSQLWYDDRDIPFLQEDLQDSATIQQTQAATIKSLIDAGYKPDSVIAAVNSNDFTKLVHTGLYSVQLQPPGTKFTPSTSPPTDPPPPKKTTELDDEPDDQNE